MWIFPKEIGLFYQNLEQVLLIFFGRDPEKVWESVSLPTIKFRNNDIFSFQPFYSYLKMKYIAVEI